MARFQGLTGRNSRRRLGSEKVPPVWTGGNVIFYFRKTGLLFASVVLVAINFFATRDSAGG